MFLLLLAFCLSVPLINYCAAAPEEQKYPQIKEYDGVVVLHPSFVIFERPQQKHTMQAAYIAAQRMRCEDFLNEYGENTYINGETKLCFDTLKQLWGAAKYDSINKR